MKTALELIAMGVLSSLGSYFLKRSTAGGLSPFALLKTPWLYVGGGLYAASSLLNLYLLKILPYSVVVPLGALTYIWTIIISRVLLNEPVTGKKILGIILILTGVTLIALN